MDKNRDAVKSFLRGLAESVRAPLADRETSSRIMSRVLKIREGEALDDAYRILSSEAAPDLFPTEEGIANVVKTLSYGVVQKFSHDCFYQTSMESELKKIDLRPCRDTVVVTGIGSNNCVYHAVIGFHVRNYFIREPEDCVHATRPEGQRFALSQFRSPAYNFNVTVTRSQAIKIAPPRGGLAPSAGLEV